MAQGTIRLEKEKEMVMGKDVLRVLVQLGGIAPWGVYAIPQKFCLSRESLMKVLGSPGFVSGTTEELGGVPLPLLVEARLPLFLLLFETATPTPTPIPTRARKPTTEPKIYVCGILKSSGDRRGEKRRGKRTIHLRLLLLPVSYFSRHGSGSRLRYGDAMGVD